MFLESLTSEIVLQRFLSILLFPVNNPEFLPSLIPIFLGLAVIELYFGKYSFEQLGWNSAVSNAVLILATALTLIVRLNLLGAPSGPRYTVAYGVLLLGLFILIMDFYHVWPASIAFVVSSGFATYTSVYISIAWVYDGLPLDANTLAASALFMISFYLLFEVIQHMEEEVLPEQIYRPRD
ncbi:MAG: hypothetical protein MUP63_00075 [Candidatus Nanohaloarchaeota archaeon QJJ-7]|nr:hypothetical protein [Candidatus Nanohaloarchaeota archaeon QJJ-7]